MNVRIIKGSILSDVRAKAKCSLKIGKRYPLKSQQDGEVVKMKLIGSYPRFATFKRANGQIESFLYQDIYFKTRLCG